MAFGRECDVSERHVPGLQGGNHMFRLGWRHDSIFQALQQNHRARQAIGKVHGRTLAVKLGRFRIGPDQSIGVSGFEFVRVLGKFLEIRNTKVAGAGRKDIVKDKCA